VQEVHQHRPPAVIVGGVSLTGKTTLLNQLREQGPFATEFFEGDDFHTPESIAKMSRGEPLDGEDRTIWKQRIGQLIAERPPARVRVITCSALARSLRDALRSYGEVRIIYLVMSRERAEMRAAHRLAHEPAHFFQPARHPALLDGQFRDREVPQSDETDCLVVDLEDYADGDGDKIDSDAVFQTIINWLQQGAQVWR